MKQRMLIDIGILAQANARMNACIHPLVFIVMVSESTFISTSVFLLGYADTSASLEFAEIVHAVEKLLAVVNNGNKRVSYSRINVGQFWS